MGRRRPSLLRLLFLLALCGLLLAGATPPACADEVTDWNVRAIDVRALAGHNNIVMTRGLAMAHLATHDALNAIDRRYEPYLFDRRAEPGAAADAALAAAMRDVLLGALAGFGTPEQHARAREKVEAAYTAALARVAEGRARHDGIAVGQAAAAAILTLRKSDGATATVSYTPGTQPGQWRPHPNPVPANPPVADSAMA